jgi:sugar phosphate isomerase/epimerase
MTRIKISVMTMVFGDVLAKGTLTDVKLLETLESWGFDGVELPSGLFRDRPELLNVYRSCLANSKLEVTCIDGGCNFIGIDRAARAKGVEALHAAIEVAVVLKCPLVLAAGSHLGDGVSPADGRRMIVEGLQTCLPAARETGVTLAIENFGVAPTLQCAAADCRAVLDAVSGLAFVFDTGNFYFCGEDPLKNLEVFRQRTRHVHLKDWVKSAKPEIADVAGAPLGTGLIPNEEIVRRLIAAGAVNSFSLEVGAPGDKLAAVRRDLDTVRRWLRPQPATPSGG